MSLESEEVDAFYGYDVDVTDSHNTEVDEVPDECRVEFTNGEVRHHLGAAMTPGEEGDVPDAVFEDTVSEGIVTRFFIRRAMIDAEATVVPL